MPHNFLTIEAQALVNNIDPYDLALLFVVYILIPATLITVIFFPFIVQHFNTSHYGTYRYWLPR